MTCPFTFVLLAAAAIGVSLGLAFAQWWFA